MSISGSGVSPSNTLISQESPQLEAPALAVSHTLYSRPFHDLCWLLGISVPITDIPRSQHNLPQVLADCVGDLIVRDTAHVASTAVMTAHWGCPRLFPVCFAATRRVETVPRTTWSRKSSTQDQSLTHRNSPLTL